MLGILKVNAGIGTDGSAEFSVTLVDVNDQVYEVDIDDRAYAQFVGVIEETTGFAAGRNAELTQPVEENKTEKAVGNGNGLNNLTPEKRAAIAKLLSGDFPQAPQHQIDGEQQQGHMTLTMSDVGFVDYSAELYDDDEGDYDPGEDLVGSEDEYVEPI